MLNYKIITCSGDNAATFLQGQLTADISQLNKQNFHLTAYCNPQGRIWCIGRIWRDGQLFHLLVPSEIAAEVTADLNKYAVFSKVTVLINNDYVVIPWHGKNISSVHLLNAFKLLPISHHRGLIIAPKEFLGDLKIKLKELNLTELTPHEWELAEIREGIPNIWQQTITQLLPHDVNLPELKAIAFDKGCYKGQEIIARMQYRGQRKKHLYYASCGSATAMQPGDKIIDNEQQHVGEIVSVALNSANQYEFLAILADAIVAQHINLSVNSNVIPAACVEIKLPHE